MKHTKSSGEGEECNGFTELYILSIGKELGDTGMKNGVNVVRKYIKLAIFKPGKGHNNRVAQS